MTNLKPANPEPTSTASLAVSASSEPPDWTGYLIRHQEATLLHDPRWGAVMQEAYGNRPYYLTAQRSAEVVGVLQLVLQKSLLFGTHLSSLPYLDAAGILADDAAASDALIAEARRLMEEVGAKWVELRHAEAFAAAMPSRTDKVTLRLSLPSDAETLWEAFTPKVRNQIRKGERSGLGVEGGGRELLKAFHAVYARTMRDLGSPSHSRRFFRLLVEHFEDAARLFVVRLDGRPVAASFTLTDGVGTRVPWAASDWRLRSLNANMLLYWHMLKWACEGGSPCFDFGRSTRESGTYRFKRQWGAEDVPLYWQYVLPAGGCVPEVRPDNPKYRFLVSVWRRLPVGVARFLGPPLIAKLS